MFEGLQLPMDLALAVESKHFANILLSKEAAAMIRSMFLSMGELNKGARRPANVPPTKLKKIGVLGAGFMGAGIAYVSANAGLEVVLIDRDQESADKGKAYSDKVVSSQIAKGRAKTADKEALLARIKATADYAELKGCDLVIEAVFEDRAVKAEATKKAQAVLGPDVVFASNTSTLPITSLAETSLKPEHFIGVHFFSPVEKMMLVEIIKGEKTDAKALATAMDFVRAIKKTPIVVNDCRGFYVNRCVMALHGRSPRNGDGGRAAGDDRERRQDGGHAGRPAGAQRRDGRRPRLEDPSGDREGSRRERGRSGAEEAHRDDGGQGRPLRPQERQGLLRLSGERAEEPVAGLAAIVGKRLDPDTVSVKDLKDRFLFTAAIEAARCMFEGVVTDPREADVGSILGFGFAPYSGGTLSFIDGMGPKAFVARAKELAAKYGARFEPGEKLVADGRARRDVLRNLWREAEGGVSPRRSPSNESPRRRRLRRGLFFATMPSAGCSGSIRFAVPAPTRMAMPPRSSLTAMRHPGGSKRRRELADALPGVCGPLEFHAFHAVQGSVALPDFEVIAWHQGHPEIGFSGGCGSAGCGPPTASVIGRGR